MNNLTGNVYLIAGKGTDLPALFALLEDNHIVTHANPELYVREYGQFGIDDALELRMRASVRAFEGRRVFVTVTASMTTEAQNALLKTLEEPAGDALFFFIVPSPMMLLSTVRSRSQSLALAESHSKVVSLVDTSVFLASTPMKRIELLKPLLEKGDDDRRDIGSIIAFLAAIESSLEKGIKRPELRAGLDAIYRARKYITDKGALVKPLLEQVALIVPVV